MSGGDETDYFLHIFGTNKNGWQSFRSSGVAFSTMVPDLQPFF